MIVDNRRAVSYGSLDGAATQFGSAFGRTDLDEARVALFIPPSVEFLIALLGIWKVGGVAVPLNLSSPATELEVVLRDADVSVIVTAPDPPDVISTAARSVGVDLMPVTDRGSVEMPSLPNVDPDRRALIVYTSGTTGRPKGVVTTHANITAQIRALVAAW